MCIYPLFYTQGICRLFKNQNRVVKLTRPPFLARFFYPTHQCLDNLPDISNIGQFVGHYSSPPDYLPHFLSHPPNMLAKIWRFGVPPFVDSPSFFSPFVLSHPPISRQTTTHFLYCKIWCGSFWSPPIMFPTNYPTHQIWWIFSIPPTNINV